MTDTIDKIKQLSESYFEDVLSIRRHLHSHPELSFQEHKTADFIEQQLRDMGITDFERKAETGITFLLKGKEDNGKVVAMRADIDALPITEANEVPYKSKNEGVMHACGHDVHTSSLLGAVRILKELKDHYSGTVKVVFQPGEEKLPGGASLMIKEGVLENPKPHRMLGQHVMPLIPAGKVGFRKGMYMASADEIYFTVKGKGGHAAMPENAIDPVLITSHIIVALQQIVSRNCSPKIPSVLSFGKVEANGATNVIPNEVKVQGTFRTYDEEWRADAHQRMTKMAEGIAESMGATCEFQVMKGYPHLKNHPEYTAANIQAAKAYLGDENVQEIDMWLAGEDFAYYSQEVDACFYRLGTRNEEKGIVSGVHTPTFDIDESALKIGMGLFAWLTMAELNNG
ncbi:M20 metallopeptidase family protein [Marinoscillum furvescens]|uniref:Amidohydrolase n=1 Tax=Marinoscillum furvescens DSM 4134 TaxID=1122208 RepID=A0A3D9LGW6_MARFU|nr:M20 family metallopeptidase [Marinoscillum furvescens]REE05857.1 amidohydrolase [Marinoscillum furvescens DSM 4134]